MSYQAQFISAFWQHVTNNCEQSGVRCGWDRAESHVSVQEKSVRTGCVLVR